MSHQFTWKRSIESSECYDPAFNHLACWNMVDGCTPTLPQRIQMLKPFSTSLLCPNNHAKSLFMADSLFFLPTLSLFLFSWFFDFGLFYLHFILRFALFIEMWIAKSRLFDSPSLLMRFNWVILWWNIKGSSRFLRLCPCWVFAGSSQVLDKLEGLS